MSNTVMIEVPVINPATNKLAGLGVSLEYQVGKPILQSKFMGFTKSANVEWCTNTFKYISEKDAFIIANIFGKILFN